MIAKQDLQEIIDTWISDIQKKEIIERKEIATLTSLIKTRQIAAISGVRRSGKTYLMFQVIQNLLKKHPNNVLYINFEDERFFEEVGQLDLVYKTFLEHRGPRGKLYFFFDEIQNIKNWEKWMARMYEKPIKFFVSGSNASLLQTEFSKSLTGRHKLITVYPLSFHQSLSYWDKELLKPSMAIERVSKVRHFLERYIEQGGFPEVVYSDQVDILQDYFHDIITRDIILRRNLKFKQSLKEIAHILMTNISRTHSLYSLNKILKARSINTIKNYLSYLEDAYLLFKVPFFAYSIKKQLSNPFKIYAIDTGLRNSVAFHATEDTGPLYENIVALELMRRFSPENIYYWKDDSQREVDFVIRQGTKTLKIIQVCYNLEAPKTREREIRALLSAAEELKCEDLTIITGDLMTQETVKKKKIEFIPLWKWLLDQ